MKILKHSGRYLKERSERHGFALAILLAIGLPITWFLYTSGSFLVWLSLILVVLIGVYLFQNYSSYRRGHKGEELVTDVLSCLSDEYYLINDVMLRDGYGNIDHIALGPNGVFVIETKNFVGQVMCNGDEWTRRYLGPYGMTLYPLRSPSRQVKRNATRIKRLVDNLGALRSLDIWIDGLVVFAGRNVKLRIENPTVAILRIDELCEYIKTKQSRCRLSEQELRIIGEAILEHAN